MSFEYKVGWNLLNNDADWQAYQRDFQADWLKNHTADPCVSKSSFRWGACPAEYPVMVTALVLHGMSVITAMMYAPDATKLVTAFKAKVKEQLPVPTHERLKKEAEGLDWQKEQQRMREEAEEMRAYASSVPPNPIRVTQSDYNKSMAAHAITLVGVLVKKGLITEAEYERSYTANLSAVDRWSGEDRDKIARAVEGSAVIMDSLGGKP